MGRITRKKYNLPALEDNLRDSYASHIAEPKNEDHKLRLFYDIEKIAYAILSVKYDAKNFSRQEIAYEYAIYLLQRILSQEFTPVAMHGKFPWQFYINQNIKHILFTKIKETSSNPNLDEYSDLENYTHNEVNVYFQVEDNYIRKIFEDRLLEQLGNFYTEDDIKRLYPLAIKELLADAQNKLVPDNLPKDLEGFLITTIALAKKLAKDLNITKKHSPNFQIPIEEAIQNSIKSTLFLSTIGSEDKFPKGLFMSLDMDSLYRLIATMGGKTIRIPTEREMDTLIAAVVTLGAMIGEGKSFQQAFKIAKSEYQCVLSKQINIRNFVKELGTNLIKNDTASTPLMQTLDGTVGFLNELFKELLDRVKEEPTQHIIDLYTRISTNQSNIMENLITVSTKIEDL